jgi:protoporphyrinogen oxidase
MRIAIIGAGVAGLATAKVLTQAYGAGRAATRA